MVHLRGKIKLTYTYQTPSFDDTKDGVFVYQQLAEIYCRGTPVGVGKFGWHATLGIVRGRGPTRSVGRDEVGTCSDGTKPNLSTATGVIHNKLTTALSSKDREDYNIRKPQ